MRRSIVSLALALFCPTVVIAQHHPSPGTSFDQLLAMTRTAIDAHQNERAARLALLARSRLLVRPDPYAKDAMLRIFDDIDGPAVERAKKYVAMVGMDRKVVESLGKATAALKKIGDDFAAQAESLLERKYKKCVIYVIEPLWAFDPERALSLHEKVDAIDDKEVPEDDDTSNTSLRLSESMVRGANGQMQVAIGEDSAMIKKIKELRSASALAMVEAAQAAVAAHFPWAAIDISEVTSIIFAFDANHFTATCDAAWKALATQRSAASKAILSKWFSSPKKTLPNTGWTVAGDVVRFPPAKAQRGLFLSSKQITGDFSLVVDIATDFDHRQVGLVFAYKNDDDFCALFVKRFDGMPGFLMSHYVKGQPTSFGKWIESSKTVVGDDLPAWPLALERHGDTMCFAIGEFSWSFIPAKDLDLSGSVGLFCDDQGTFPDKAEASRWELEELPAVKTDDH